MQLVCVRRVSDTLLASLVIEIEKEFPNVRAVELLPEVFAGLVKIKTCDQAAGAAAMCREIYIRTRTGNHALITPDGNEGFRQGADLMMGVIHHVMSVAESNGWRQELLSLNLAAILVGTVTVLTRLQDAADKSTIDSFCDALELALAQDRFPS